MNEDMKSIGDGIAYLGFWIGLGLWLGAGSLSAGAVMVAKILMGVE